MTKRFLSAASMAALAWMAGAPAAAQASVAPQHRIAICDDENELPPFSFFERSAGARPALMGGFSIAVLRDILVRRGLDYTVELKPWPRCVAMTSLGTQFTMLMNLTYSVEREKHLLFTRPFAHLTSFYYYSRKRFPNGLPIASAADLQNYRVCGIMGHNYEGYGMAPGQVDQGARNLESLIGKLKLERCTLFLEKDEIMLGYAALGKSYLATADIAKAPVPGLKPTPFHFGISKRYARAEELRRLIDEELMLMEASGKLAEIWKSVAAHARR